MCNTIISTLFPNCQDGQTWLFWYSNHIKNKKRRRYRRI